MPVTLGNILPQQRFNRISIFAELTQMWDKLTHGELEAARQELKSQREEMLRRHAEELIALETDQAEIEKLDQLIDAFAQNLKNATTLSFDPTASAEKGANGEHSGVSLLITQAQKVRLRELGIADEQIRNMKPNDAHLILGLAG
jgi:hypothetical protein